MLLLKKYNQPFHTCHAYPYPEEIHKSWCFLKKGDSFFILFNFFKDNKPQLVVPIPDRCESVPNNTRCLLNGNIG